MAAVLFASHDRTTFVLDIPSSLEVGNGGGRIFSVVARDTPYLTPEPKGKKRETFIATLSVDHVEYHDGVRVGVEGALHSTSGPANVAQWCLARLESSYTRDVLSRAKAQLQVGHREHLPIVLSSLPNDFLSESSIMHELVFNENGSTTCLRISGQKHIMVPGTSTFLWSDLQRSFAIMQQYDSSSCLQFDLIVMDPPWPNRSVRNGAKYATSDTQMSDPFEDALRIVDRFRKPNGFVAIWITNKEFVRKQVLRSMSFLGFTLEEEWIWVKVTSKGEPIFPLDGVWRRPYEILMLFHHQNHSCTPKRRHVFAVPDAHSRKPNLKPLFDMLLQSSSVLELFARNLTSGWWSVGDEVLKFQDRDSWYQWPPGACPV